MNLPKSADVIDEAKANYERDIELMNRNLQRDTADAKQEMDEDQQKILQDLGPKIMQVVNKYAVDNQISIVFDVGGEPNNIRFASSAVDITRDIIALYDKAAPVTPTAPPSKPSTSAAPAPKPAAPAAKPAGRPQVNPAAELFCAF